MHGPRKLIDVAEADALWGATMSPQGAANARVNPAQRPAASVDRQPARAGTRGCAARRHRDQTAPA